MSVGRISTFLDIYIERDLKAGKITEKEAQELIDHMVMKFRMVKFARSILQRTVLRRPDMGNTGSWWTWTGRTFYGNKE